MADAFIQDDPLDMIDYDHVESLAALMDRTAKAARQALSAHRECESVGTDFLHSVDRLRAAVSKLHECEAAFGSDDGHPTTPPAYPSGGGTDES